MTLKQTSVAEPIMLDVSSQAVHNIQEETGTGEEESNTSGATPPTKKNLLLVEPLYYGYRDGNTSQISVENGLERYVLAPVDDCYIYNEELQKLRNNVKVSVTTQTKLATTLVAPAESTMETSLESVSPTVPASSTVPLCRHQ